MRTALRKKALVRAVDLRDRRKRAGLTAGRLADMLEVADSKHVSAIELGKCTITMERAVRAAYAVRGPITVELPGLGQAAVIPVKERARYASAQGPMRPGEAAWIALEEAKEAVDCLPSIQRAVARQDKAALVALAEQVVCDPRHAADLLAEAIDAVDPMIMVEASINHSKKLLARGVTVVTSRPFDAA